MRICGYCNTPREDDQFYPGKAKCKPCQAAYKRDLRKGVHHPIIKPEHRACRICGVTSDKAEFKDGANICVSCWKEWKSSYDKENREKLSAQVQEWKVKNRDHFRESERKHYNTPEGKAKHVARVEKTHRSWMSHLISRSQYSAESPGPHDPKEGIQREFDIDLDYVSELWEKQGGKCAVTGLQMLTEYNNLMSVSVDRLDNSKGHTKGNIQLVCQWVNMAKKHYSNSEFQSILDQYFNVRMSTVPTVVQSDIPDIKPDHVCNLV